jgi:hypothetical protein
MTPRWDAFLSHASEDKESFVRPLVGQLSMLGVRVWYDEFSLRVGDSLSRSIDRGLAESRYGVVVLSPAFLSKRWPERELRGLVAREVAGTNVILPVWLNVSRDDVLRYSPPLADTFAIPATDDLLVVALHLLQAIRPDIFEHIRRRAVFQATIAASPSIEVEHARIVPGPIRHRTFTNDVLVRMRLVHQVLEPAFPRMSLASSIDGFRRDENPLNELAIWERIAVAFLSLRSHPVAGADPQECGRVLLQQSFGEDARIQTSFDESVVAQIRAAFENAHPRIESAS